MTAAGIVEVMVEAMEDQTAEAEADDTGLR
jgi:hypothetical protein